MGGKGEGGRGGYRRLLFCFDLFFVCVCCIRLIGQYTFNMLLFCLFFVLILFVFTFDLGSVSFIVCFMECFCLCVCCRLFPNQSNNGTLVYRSNDGFFCFVLSLLLYCFAS